MSATPSSPKRKPRNITPYTNGVVQRTFIDTADLNYLGARAAYFEYRHWDFWWLTLHALEKYLKAIILMNGGIANGATHNIKTLMGRVAKIVDSRLVPPNFQKPRISGLDSWPGNPPAFIDRLNEYGSAANRYGVYGYSISISDLLCADQLIFWARRHARSLKWKTLGKEFDWIEALARDPFHWEKDGHLGKVAKLSSHDPRRWMFTRLNAAFFPAQKHELKRRHSAGTNSVIADWYGRLQASSDDGEDRITPYLVLEWVRDHIHFGPEDKKALNDALEARPLPAQAFEP